MKKFWTLTRVLKELPNVQPNKTKKELEEFLNTSENNSEVIFTNKDRIEIWIEDEDYLYQNKTIRTSSIGALKIVELYFKKKLVMNGAIQKPSLELMEYIQKGYSRVNDLEYEKQVMMWIEDKDTLPESEFTFHILNKIFWKHNGSGACTMMIGGKEVTKSVSKHFSNSRKSSDHEVIISWIGSDNEWHQVTKESKYSGNRRSDPNRNWGLGRD